MQNNKTDWKTRELGSFWPKKDFFTGRIKLSNLDAAQLSGDSPINVIMFKNNEQNEAHTRPVFNMYISDGNPSQQNTQQNTQQSQKAAQSSSNDSSTEDDDIMSSFLA